MQMDVVALPDDVIAEVLRRVPPRSLAAVRCVCKAWRAMVDARGLLLPRLLPHSVHGIFFSYIDHGRPHLFVRPSSTSTVPRIDRKLSFTPNNFRKDWWSVQDHCNGLLLCEILWWRMLCVCNPATQRWKLLPQLTETRRWNAHAYLVFDPAVSSHFEVFLIPTVPEKPTAPQNHRKVVEERRPALLRREEMDAPFCLERLFSLPDAASAEDTEEFQQQVESPPDFASAEDTEEFQQQVESPQPPPAPSVEEDEPDDPWCLMEWPPSPWRLNVFSSRTGRWERRAFVREGEPAGTVADMRLDPLEPTMWGPRRRYAVYWQGAIYVHCRGAFVTRFSLSNDKYQVIKMPADVKKECVKPYLGRSEKGVYFGTVNEWQLQVWILNESCGQMEWVLEYQHDLRPIAQQVGSRRDAAWMVINNINVHDNTKTISEENFEWDSDNDDFLPIDGGREEYCYGRFNILGFHPFKEVVFLGHTLGAVAYHLNNSKAQYLGYLCANSIYESFLYTPCMIGELSRSLALGTYNAGS